MMMKMKLKNHLKKQQLRRNKEKLLIGKESSKLRLLPSRKRKLNKSKKNKMKKLN